MNKKSFLLFFAWIALTGILNCVLIEPAFACQEEDVSCQTGSENHGCLICHSGHHQWMMANDGKSPLDLLQQEHFMFDRANSVLEPPLRLIFHPPLPL